MYAHRFLFGGGAYLAKENRLLALPVIEGGRRRGRDGEEPVRQCLSFFLKKKETKKNHFGKASLTKSYLNFVVLNQLRKKANEKP